MGFLMFCSFSYLSICCLCMILFHFYSCNLVVYFGQLAVLFSYLFWLELFSCPFCFFCLSFACLCMVASLCMIVLHYGFCTLDFSFGHAAVSCVTPWFVLFIELNGLHFVADFVICFSFFWVCCCLFYLCIGTSFCLLFAYVGLHFVSVFLFLCGSFHLSNGMNCVVVLLFVFLCCCLSYASVGTSFRLLLVYV